MLTDYFCCNKLNKKSPPPPHSTKRKKSPKLSQIFNITIFWDIQTFVFINFNKKKVIFFFYTCIPGKNYRLSYLFSVYTAFLRMSGVFVHKMQFAASVFTSFSNHCNKDSDIQATLHYFTTFSYVLSF